MDFPLNSPAPNYTKDELREMISELNGDPLQEAGRALVWPSGDGTSGVFILGEAPSVNDTKVGENFRGPHSQMFNEELLPSVGLSRANIYLTNLVKRNPPDFRAPNPVEINVWSPILLAEIITLKPKLVVAMGKYAMEFFLPKAKISNVRGKIFRIQLYQNYSQVVLFLLHPGFAYRNPDQAKTIWHDFQLIKQYLNGNLHSEPVPESLLNTTTFTHPDSESLF
ncbi:MAG: uracil-DNA glycosylase [Patescibacteria group bacterium]